MRILLTRHEQVLGDRALAITADSASYPETHRALARRVASEFALAHEIIRTAELDRPEYRSNPANRCYYCKQELYGHLTAVARERGFAGVVDGNNADDRGDYRPGRQAAREYGVRSPLDEADLSKEEIRMLSRQAGLPTWDVPASACLSSRIPYGDEVTEPKLRMIEQAEDVVRVPGSACSASVITTRSRVSRSRATKWHGRSSLTSAINSCAHSRHSGTTTSRLIFRDIGSAA